MIERNEVENKMKKKEILFTNFQKRINSKSEWKEIG